MTRRVFADSGRAMLNDLSSPAALIATRRSGKPRDMVLPGPSPEQLRRILASATRVPDHGKLAPWRLVVIERRDAFAALLQEAWRVERGTPDRPDVDAIDQFAGQAPSLIVLISTAVADSKIPVWEQQLSAGAAGMALLAAAHAEGFVGGWLTGWAAYSPMIAEALGYPNGRIAGFIFLGSPSRELDERPRPDLDTIASRW